MMLDIRENFISARQIEHMAVVLEADRNNWKGHECVQTETSVQIPEWYFNLSSLPSKKPQ